ncbi:MAG: PAS domain S-box protein [Chloroflexi bacterium]|nr:PAS domain S-box protein [Chloroflexota bacterium]
MKFIREFLKPPVFEDEQKTHQAYLLNIIIWGLILIPIPYVAYALISNPLGATRALIQGGVSEAINFFLLFLLKRGHVRTASTLQVATFWVFFTVSAVTGIGVQGESYLLGYPLVIVIAGILLGNNTAMGLAALSLFSGYLMVVAEGNGLINTNLVRPPFLTWVVSLAIFPMGVVLQYLSSRTINRALQRARQSEEKYRLISRVSSDYAFESRVNEDNKGETIWLAGAFEKMTGYTPEEYIKAGGWYAHIHPDDLDKDAEDMKTLLNNQDVLGSEIRTFAKNGEIRWERVFAHPIWDHEQNRLVGVVGAVQDITERKETEKRLEASLHQQKAILNNIPDMAWLKDADSRYIAVNEQYLRVSGLKYEDVIGKNDFEIWDKSNAEMYRKDDIEVMQSGQRKTVEEMQRDSTGREYWVETTKTPIRNERGEVIGTTGIARDISERKAAEMERERFITELGTKNAELERFTYTVSHDLKSPLVTITGFLGYLNQDARNGKFEDFSRDMHRIRQAVDKMQNLLNDLLELSRIGRMVNEPMEIGFGGIVRDALALLEGPLTAGRVHVDFADEGHKVYGDRVRLLEVMQNLLENAIKFMGAQTNPEIRIGSIKDEQGKPVFFVQDNGVGIEPQYQNRIFGLFNKLDSNTEGTGIGLTLVKRIIEVHHGKIWLESQPGKGTTFYFTLPGTSIKP